MNPVLKADQAARRKRDAEGLPVPRDQLRVELVEEVARVGDLQVAAVGLQEALERGLGLVVGQAGGRDHVSEGGATAQVRGARP